MLQLVHGESAVTSIKGKNMWQTIGYRIESASIQEYPTVYKQVFFLDAVQTNNEGRISTSNLTSGTKEECESMLHELGGELVK
jgi:hypothetical protein